MTAVCVCGTPSLGLKLPLTSNRYLSSTQLQIQQLKVCREQRAHHREIVLVTLGQLFKLLPLHRAAQGRRPFRQSGLNQTKVHWPCWRTCEASQWL